MLRMWSDESIKYGILIFSWPCSRRKRLMWLSRYCLENGFAIYIIYLIGEDGFIEVGVLVADA